MNAYVGTILIGKRIRTCLRLERTSRLELHIRTAGIASSDFLFAFFGVSSSQAAMPSRVIRSCTFIRSPIVHDKNAARLLDLSWASSPPPIRWPPRYYSSKSCVYYMPRSAKPPRYIYTRSSVRMGDSITRISNSCGEPSYLHSTQSHIAVQQKETRPGRSDGEPIIH